MMTVFWGGVLNDLLGTQKVEGWTPRGAEGDPIRWEGVMPYETIGVDQVMPYESIGVD